MCPIFVDKSLPVLEMRSLSTLDLSMGSLPMCSNWSAPSTKKTQPPAAKLTKVYPPGKRKQPKVNQFYLRSQRSWNPYNLINPIVTWIWSHLIITLIHPHYHHHLLIIICDHQFSSFTFFTSSSMETLTIRNHCKLHIYH